jgi:hypothetical protein
MRLSEIIQHKRTVSEPPIDDDMRADPADHGLGNKGDDASFSFVTPADDPHEVRKYNRTPDNSLQDGFVLYAKYVVKHKLWDNVHFPKIYVTNQAASHGDEEFYDWTMERLTWWKDISEEEYLAMIDRYFSIPVAELLRSKGDDLSYGEQFRFAQGISDILRAMLRGDMAVDVIDDELLDALRHLVAIKEEIGFKLYDLHRFNIMYRRTPVGTQLVFSDPFGYGPDY